MALEHRARANGSVYRSAKKRFVRNAEPICGVCGRHVDKTLKFPHPGSPSVDHIQPLARGGKAMDQSGWQLAHLGCNRWKSDKLDTGQRPDDETSDSPCSGIHHWSREHYDNDALTGCPLGNGWHAPWIAA